MIYLFFIPTPAITLLLKVYLKLLQDCRISDTAHQKEAELWIKKESTDSI